MKTHGRWYVQCRFRSYRYTQPDWVTYSSHAERSGAERQLAWEQKYHGGDNVEYRIVRKAGN